MFAVEELDVKGIAIGTDFRSVWNNEIFENLELRKSDWIGMYRSDS